ncbi:FKBP-type peptidyl-prolyl cis-trans isomerase [Actomonas aquatica]|uniref:Peptidyl-prolyl cis-trans isomerase n=1 Tax=Actomonas aquatica TaxID=2866162 RepID=A0ABZ1CFA2_9BACT|nr:FKBP-type peptidyl-prolyl cis-trans isomerase [Opitutus sp. WL0086]WRQ90035.1 FKBP-type peptidyl-prolyl cis-trans isomerase [Opitutus sp. WL0086]
MRRFLFLLVTLLLTTAAASAQREKLPPRDLIIVEERYPNAEVNSTGLRTVLMQPGTGAKPERGDTVEVLYKGTLLDGTMFDQRIDPEKPFTFQLDRGQVIDGWEYGLLMMREGEKRTLIVPYELGYGTRGRSPDIPRMATLIFEVELLKVIPRSVPGQ